MCDKALKPCVIRELACVISEMGMCDNALVDIRDRAASGHAESGRPMVPVSPSSGSPILTETPAS